jgi:hypothetical protein
LKKFCGEFTCKFFSDNPNKLCFARKETVLLIKKYVCSAFIVEFSPLNKSPASNKNYFKPSLKEVL